MVVIALLALVSKMLTRYGHAKQFCAIGCLISELDTDDRAIIFKMIDKMLTTKKFKDFFSKNVASL